MPLITLGGKHESHHHSWVDEDVLVKMICKLNLILEKLDVLEQGENHEEIEDIIIRIDKIRNQLKKTV